MEKRPTVKPLPPVEGWSWLWLAIALREVSEQGARTGSENVGPGG
jgi:hypothetical protein